MKLLVAVPCFNEEEVIVNCLEALEKINLADKLNFEILVVNDGSKDSSFKKIINYAVTSKTKINILNSSKNYGLSEVFNSTLNFAERQNFDYLIIFDADLQYPHQQIKDMFNFAINKDIDLLIGVRNFHKVEHFTLIKKVLQIFGSFVVSFFAGYKISDVTSGFRVYSKAAITELRSTNDFTYTIETIFQAKHLNLKVDRFELSEIKKTRDSKLFKSNKEYVIKSIKILTTSSFLYSNKIINLLYLIFLSPGIFLSLRFFVPYFKYGYNNNNLQSFMFSLFYIVIVTVFFNIIKLKQFQLNNMNKLFFQSKISKHKSLDS